MLAIWTRLSVVLNKLSQRCKLLATVQIVVVTGILYFDVSHLAVTPAHHSAYHKLQIRGFPDLIVSG